MLALSRAHGNNGVRQEVEYRAELTTKKLVRKSARLLLTFAVYRVETCRTGGRS
jgi:hypothetical protein